MLLHDEKLPVSIYQPYNDTKNMIIQFSGDILHEKGDFKARKITGELKEKYYGDFKKDPMLKPSDVYHTELGKLDSNQYGFQN